MLTIPNARKELVRLFLENGCIRLPKPVRVKEGYQHYKKGYEIRWTASNRDEEFIILRSLAKLGFKHGKPFKKVNRTIIPVYGHDNLMEFQKMIKGASSNATKKSKTMKRTK